MNIGIYSPYLDTLTGGEKYIFTAASCLSKEHKVTIFWDEGDVIKKASEKFNLDLSNVTVSENIFTNKFGVFKRFLKTLRYDRIIYLSDGSIPIVGARKLLVHFQFPVEWVNTNSFIFLFKKSRISKIICNSRFTKSYIDKKFNTDSYVLYPPSSSNSGKIPEKENTILTVGRYSMLPNKTDFKKLEMLAVAFKMFQKKRLKGWNFKIVTSVSPDLLTEFAKFEEKYSSKYIKIYKNVLFSEISELYGRSSIYWHAAGFEEDLEKNPERAEHFGISTVEAMSFGSVPVVINAGGQPEIVKDGDNGYLWNTQDELIEITHKLAISKELLEKVSQRAIESSKNFTTERFCEELNHIIW